jgi:hypothetical protein
MREIEINPLRDCPFCGSIPRLEQIGLYKIRIKCSCGIKKEQQVLRYTIEWVREIMINAWNNRRGSKE